MKERDAKKLAFELYTSFKDPIVEREREQATKNAFEARQNESDAYLQQDIVRVNRKKINSEYDVISYYQLYEMLDMPIFNTLKSDILFMIDKITKKANDLEDVNLFKVISHHSYFYFSNINLNTCLENAKACVSQSPQANVPI